MVLPPSACLKTLQVVRDEISNHFNELKQDMEPNMFLGLIANPSPENSLASNQARNVDLTVNPMSSDDSSGLTESEDETGTSNVSRGAIPKILVSTIYSVFIIEGLGARTN